MSKNVALIIPYFGKFPNYFDYWLKSALANPNFDFLIFTDNERQSINNVHFINMSFNQFKNLLQSKVSFKITLDTPYKLCDYRPLFGCALQEFIKNYKFWGFCDVDLIFGDLNKFITPKVLKEYDKIYDFGHLTLIRNNEFCNSIWKIKHHSSVYRYDEAFKTPYACHFDENGGLKKIAELSGLRCYHSIDFADIDYTKYNFFLIGKQKQTYAGLFEWKNGKLKYYYLRNKNIFEEEVAYAHFQKRPLEICNSKTNFKSFLIIPNKILTDTEYKPTLLNQRIKMEYPYWNKRKKIEFIKNKKHHSLQQHIYRSFFRKYYRKVLDKK